MDIFSPGRLKTVLMLVLTVLVVNISFHFLIAQFIAYSGDEEVYLSSSKQLLAVGISDLHAGLLEAVGTGWFSFGMSLVLCPIVLISDQPEVVRLIMSLLNLLISVWVFRLVLEILNPRSTAILFAAYSLNPMSLFFSTTIWADYLASQIILVASLHLYLCLSDDRQRRPVVIGVAMGITMLLRPSLILGCLSLTLGAFLMLPGLNKESLKRSSRLVALPLLIGMFLYSPQAYFLSTKMETVVLTTVTQDVNFIRFFSRSELKGKIKASNEKEKVNIQTTHDYIQMQSELSGRPFAVELARHRNAVISELTLDHYFGIVNKQVKKHLFDENRFLQGRFFDEFQGRKSSWHLLFYGLIGIVNTALWYSLLLALAWTVVALGLPFLKTSPQVLYSTPFLLSFLVQPFVSVAHARYISGFMQIYLVWIAIGLLVTADRSRGGVRLAQTS